MKTIIKEITVYDYMELNEKVKNKIMYDIAENNIEFDIYDVNNSLDKIKSYLSNAPELDGVRLFKWIVNHLPLSTPKTYYKNRIINAQNQKKRTSKIFYNFDCPYTGVCFDWIALDAINELKQRLKDGRAVTTDDFFDILKDKAQKEIDDSYQSMFEDDYINEECAANGWTFTADGKLCC